jgi:ribonuclease P protein component
LRRLSHALDLVDVPHGFDLNVQRMKTRPQFQAALAGKTLGRTAHFALHSCSLEQKGVDAGGAHQSDLFPVAAVWMGAMIPKRWAKRAVTRNTIKRQIYTVSSEFQHVLPLQAHVVRLRSGFDRKEFVSATSNALKHSVREELVRLFSSVPAPVGAAT